MNDERIVNIEIKVAQHDDLLDALNQTIYRQQKQIDELERMCAALASHIKQLQDAGNERASGNERPPHY